LASVLTDLKIVEALGLSYKNARELNKIIDQKLPSHPHFHRHDIQIGDETVVMYSRDILECIKSLYSNPEFAAHLLYKPEQHYHESVNESRHIFHDMHTGSWWWEMQVTAEPFV
jgi:hypothetical protein